MRRAMYGFLGKIPKWLLRIISQQRPVEDVAGVKPILSALKTDTAKRDGLDEMPLTYGIDLSTDPRFRIIDLHAEHRKSF